MKPLLALLVFLLAVLMPAAQPQKAESPGVEVTLTSDRETWVSITNMRAPQRFERVTIKLPPGAYDVVGRRRGYRDENRRLTVSPGAAPIILHIVCTVNAAAK